MQVSRCSMLNTKEYNDAFIRMCVGIPSNGVGLIASIISKNIGHTLTIAGSVVTRDQYCSKRNRKRIPREKIAISNTVRNKEEQTKRQDTD